jgi:hypothetical protein
MKRSTSSMTSVAWLALPLTTAAATWDRCQVFWWAVSAMATP